MTTRNYKMKFKKADPFTVYATFKDKYKDNIIDTINTSYSANSVHSIDYYDINNTAVLVGSDFNFQVPKGENVYWTNLRITGLEENINKIENEIVSKGFKLSVFTGDKGFTTDEFVKTK
jgi:hypothetical protein